MLPTQPNRETKEEYYQKFEDIIQRYDDRTATLEQIYYLQANGTPSHDPQVERLRDRWGQEGIDCDHAVEEFIKWSKSNCGLVDDNFASFQKHLDDAEFRHRALKHIKYVRSDKTTKVKLPLHPPDYIWQVYRRKRPPEPDPDQGVLF